MHTCINTIKIVTVLQKYISYCFNAGYKNCFQIIRVQLLAMIGVKPSKDHIFLTALVTRSGFLETDVNVWDYMAL